MTDSDRIDRVVDILRSSSRIFFITGAGISADSGLPTYRGIGGLYDNRTTDEGLSIEDALSGDTMELNPALTWKYLAQMEENCRRAKFNRAHEVIAEMERSFEAVWVLTQNIDGFHRAAGSRNVIDIHGDIHGLSCMSCDYRCDVEHYGGLEIPPRCPECDAYMRPEVVLFGEMLPFDKTGKIEQVWREGFDIVFSVGTTSVFPYIVQPVLLGRRMGIPTVEINPGNTQVSDAVDIKIAGKAAATLDEIWKRYRENREIKNMYDRESE
ncbi:NAD-dependent deacylase [bacterium]|nr:NAD-dependent deacylase [bacterium]